MAGSPLKVYIEYAKKEILDRSWNAYEDLPENLFELYGFNSIEELKVADKVVWAVLEHIEDICKKRGRY